MNRIGPPNSREFAKMVTTQQVEPVSFRILSRLVCQRPRFVHTELYLQGSDHALCNVAFHGENVFHVTIVTVGPEMKAIGDVNQLRRNPQLVTGFAHAAFQHAVDVQLLTDFSKNIFLVFPFKREGRTPAWHSQSFHFREHIDQFLCHTIAEILIRFVCTHVHEWQHRDRLLRDRDS